MNRLRFTIIIFVNFLTFSVDSFRERRHLIYVNSGVYKFILGVGIPINVEMKGVSLNWSANLQGLYRLPDNITYFDDYKIISKRSLQNHWKRNRIYFELSQILTKMGIAGEECINRMICEISQGHVAADDNGLFGRILHVLFSPLQENLKTFTKHKKAQLQGILSDDACGEIYKNCSLADVLFQDL